MKGSGSARLSAAVDARAGLETAGHTTYRLVHAESDFVPGLTVDRYGDYLVIQAGTLGIDVRKDELATILQQLTGSRGVFERSDLPLRRREGLDAAQGCLCGDTPAGLIEVHEHGLRFLVDVTGGQKTGFYLDQRENRRQVAAYCSGKHVLNAFSYTGAFAVYTLAAGATHVTDLDVSVPALEMAEQNMLLNGFDPEAVSENIAGDVFQILRDWRAPRTAHRRFDVIVLDPPKFAQSKRSVDRALRGYKDVNMLAMQLLRPGGILVSFSCSGLVDAPLFQKVLFGAALDADRPVQILERLHQAADHPVAITFPEGEYLKGLICRVL